MFISESEKEVNEAIANYKIENEVIVFKGDEKESILQSLQDIFVIGNPRAWWLSLKDKPTSYICNDEQSYKYIKNFFKEEEEVWFIVEDDECLLYKTKIINVINIIGDCSFFEYNIISKDYRKFLCENDHGEFLYIRRN